MVLSYWFYFLWQWSDLNFKFSACSGHYQMCWVAQHPIFQCLGHYYIEVFLRNVTPNATQLVSQPSLQFCCCLVANSCLTFWTPWTVAHQASLSMGFPRHEYWSGFPFPFPGDLPDPGIKPGSPAAAPTTWPSPGSGQRRRPMRTRMIR